MKTVMSDIGHALIGPNGPMNQKKFEDILRAQIGALEAQARRGLDKEAFEANKQHIAACQNAMLVVESLALYYNAQ